MQKQQALRVLIVGDPWEYAEMLAHLDEEGHETITATDGPSAVEIAHRLCPDVVFLDLDEPGIDVPWIMEVIRSHSSWIQPMLITLTKHEGNDLAHGSRMAGADLHLTQPVHGDRLMGFLRRFQRILTFDPAI